MIFLVGKRGNVLHRCRRGNMQGEAFQSLHHSPIKWNWGYFTVTAGFSQAVGWQTSLTNKQRNPLYIEIFTISVSLFSISVQSLQFSFWLLCLQRTQIRAEMIRHFLRLSKCGPYSTAQQTCASRRHTASSDCGLASNSVFRAMGLLSGPVVQLGVLKMQGTVSREHVLLCP